MLKICIKLDSDTSFVTLLHETMERLRIIPNEFTHSRTLKFYRKKNDILKALTYFKSLNEKTSFLYNIIFEIHMN